jgi:shikimate dehydrogenase
MSRAISGRTRWLGILGDPIAHACAPGLINELLRARDIDAVMVPMHVARRDLAITVAGLRGVHNFLGAIVTMPHKIPVVDCLDRLTPAAQRVGACNMLRRSADGTLEGTILDGEGFVAGLSAAGHAVAGKRVLLLGAGGAATAIGFALCAHGVKALAIHNRTRTTAAALHERLERHYAGITRVSAAADAGDYEIVINATALGMHEADDLPLDPRTLRPSMLAAEIVITAKPTPFLAAALACGCVVQPGKPMLEAQLDLMLQFAGIGHG